MGEVTETGMWEQQGLKAGNSPAVPLVEAGVRGARGEGGGNERERRMKQETEGQREARELLALEESQGGTLEAKRRLGQFYISMYHYINIATKI